MFIEATQEDCGAVAALAAKTFSGTFGHLYKPENLAEHLKEKFSTAYFEQSLATGDTLVMLRDGATLIGYAKVGTVGLPIKTPYSRGAQEIHRVYIDQPYQGRGFGKAMMLHILSLPRITTAPEVFLGVWEENMGAQALYRQYGFRPVGKYLYQVGDQFDREIIMARVR